MHNTPGTSALVVRRFDVLAPRDMRGIQVCIMQSVPVWLWPVKQAIVLAYPGLSRHQNLGLAVPWDCAQGVDACM